MLSITESLVQYPESGKHQEEGSSHASSTIVLPLIRPIFLILHTLGMVALQPGKVSATRTIQLTATISDSVFVASISFTDT